MIYSYRQLVSDKNRIEAFHKGIQTVVKPGDTVCEIGTGLGTYAFMASQAGAARVYAIERGPVIEVAKKIYAANRQGLGEIEFIRQDSTLVELPEKVDAVIYEDFEGQGVSPSHEAILQDAQQRFLKSGGTFIPYGLELYWAPLQAQKLYASEVDTLKADKDAVFGVDFGLTRKLVADERILTLLEAETVLAAPVRIEKINFAEKPHLDFVREFEMTIETPGMLHGFGSWADFIFLQGRFSLSYEKPVTLYGRSFFPLPEPVGVSAGDRVRMQVSVVQKPFSQVHIWTWWGDIVDGQGSRKYDWQSSTLQVTDFQRQDMQLPQGVSDDFQPVLNHEGQLRKVALELMNGERSLQEISAELVKRFPEHVSSTDSARARVARLVKKYAMDQKPQP